MAQFATRLKLATPRIWVVYALMGLNVAVWGAQVLSGVSPTQPSAQTLLDWGGSLGNAVYAGEYWRLLTATALHGGILHLAFNMYALYAIGRTVEQVLGNSGFAATYLISGLAGSVASALSNPSVVSVGASGAVFGILGAQLTSLLARRVGLPERMRSGVLRQGLIFIGLNLWIGFTIPNIDNAAHIGGLVAGALTGAILAHPHTRTGVAGRGRRAALVAGVGVALLTTVFALWPKSVDPLPQFAGRIDGAEARVDTIAREVNAGTTSPTDAVIALGEVLRTMTDLRKDVAGLESDDEPTRLLRALVNTRIERYEALAEYLTRPEDDTRMRLEQAAERDRAALRKLSGRAD